MYVKNIKINRFRAFQKSFQMNIGRHLTAISGMNGVGKSTILGLLVNSSEKSGEKQLNGKPFKGEFADVVIYDKDHDKAGDREGAQCSIEFNNLPDINDNTIEFRSVVQDRNSNTNNDKRFRMIPKKKDDRRTEAKIDWPVIYLGLSRIFPIGESNGASNKSIKSDTLSKDIIEVHKRLMNEHDIDVESSNFKSINLSDLKSKVKSGISTDNYSSTSNSSGQDTLGQLILAVLSFKNLKEQDEGHYNGGLLAIDEIESTLHPAVQKKLLIWLYEMSKELDLQIVFTTHSMKIIREMMKLEHKKSSGVLINYLRSIDGHVECKEDPVESYIAYDLSDTIRVFNGDQKISVYTEDTVARSFLNKIIEYNPEVIRSNSNVEKVKKISEELKRNIFSLDILDLKMSWNSLVEILTSDPYQFKNSIFILDSDFNSSNKDNYDALERMLKRKNYHGEINTSKSNLIILPGEKYGKSIEKMMWEYLTSLDSSDSFFKESFIENSGITKNRLKDVGPESDKYKTSKNNMEYKDWYEDFDESGYMDMIIEHWIMDNEEEIIEFKRKLLIIIKRIQKGFTLI